jgi:uncharacterized protein
MRFTTPVFRDLTETEANAMLRRNTYGRIAFSFHDRVDIEPIHYVFENGWIFCRTGSGTKVLTLQHNPWVAFEIDEVDELFQWRSVVAKGTAYFYQGVTGKLEDAVAKLPVGALRRLVPSALGPGDPTPERQVVFGIHVDSVRGRAAEPGKAAP